MTTPSFPGSHDAPLAVFGAEYVAKGALLDRVPMLRMFRDSAWPVCSSVQGTPMGEMLSATRAGHDQEETGICKEGLRGVH